MFFWINSFGEYWVHYELFTKLDSIIPNLFVSLPLIINLFYKLNIEDKQQSFSQT